MSLFDRARHARTVDAAGRVGVLMGGASAGVGVAELHPLVYLETDIDGAQGWSVSIETEGDCTLVGATTDGTIGGSVDDGEPGLRSGGFENDADCQCDAR